LGGVDCHLLLSLAYFTGYNPMSQNFVEDGSFKDTAEEA